MVAGTASCQGTSRTSKPSGQRSGFQESPGTWRRESGRQTGKPTGQLRRFGAIESDLGLGFRWSRASEREARQSGGGRSAGQTKGSWLGVGGGPAAVSRRWSRRCPRGMRRRKLGLSPKACPGGRAYQPSQGLPKWCFLFDLGWSVSCVLCVSLDYWETYLFACRRNYSRR